MINDFKKISVEKVLKFLSNPISIYEKLDMVYFKVKLNKYGSFPLKTPRFTAISDVDCICNSIYNDIYEFAHNSVETYREDIVDMCGDVTIGFFYLPVKKTKVIEYTELPEKTFILSDIYVEDKTRLIGIDVVYALLKNVGVKNIPLIKEITLNDEQKIKLVNCLGNNNNSLEVIRTLISETYTGNPLIDIEGIILRHNNEQYQIIVNDTNTEIDKSTKKLYRDIILKQLANLIDDDYIKKISESEETYINKVSDVFLTFMENTDIFAKYSIDPEDLLPPHIGYFGDINLELYNIKEDVKTICKVNDCAKNIYRMFLHTFTNPLSLNKFSDLQLEDVDKLSKLTIALKFRNYAQLALSI